MYKVNKKGVPLLVQWFHIYSSGNVEVIFFDKLFKRYEIPAYKINEIIPNWYQLLNYVFDRPINTIPPYRKLLNKDFENKAALTIFKNIKEYT